jgi:hypothetical protein
MGMSWRVEYRVFRCERQEGDAAFEEATAFASELEPRELISISHVLERQQTMVSVWFWSWGSFWNCPQCGERVEEQFEACWNCSTAKPTAANSGRADETKELKSERKEGNWHIAYRITRGAWLEWDDFFAEVAKLASDVGPERLIGIAHSGFKDDVMATAFFWSEEPPV